MTSDKWGFAAFVAIQIAEAFWSLWCGRLPDALYWVGGAVLTSSFLMR